MRLILMLRRALDARGKECQRRKGEGRQSVLFTENLRFPGRRQPMIRAHILTAPALALCLAACSPFGSDPLDEAQVAFAAQDYISARDHAQEALERDANNAEALELLARIQLAMGLGGEVMATLERLEQSGEEPVDAKLLAAEGLLQTGETEAARELIGNDTSAEGWRLRALAAAARGETDRAKQAYASGRDAPGERGKLFAAEASFHLAQGDLAAAQEAVSLAQEFAPGRVETLFVSARLAEAQADPVTALSNYLRIIEIVPMDRPALLAAIISSERAQLPRITRHLIAYGASTRPMDEEFVYQQARVDALDGRWEQVRERLQAHETELANHDSARLLYAEALLQLGQVETARAIAAPIFARRADDPEALRLQAAIAAAS